MITLITDSTACMTRAEAELFGVRLVPMHYTIGGTSYLESFSDCNGNFEALLAQNSGTTAQASVSDFTKVFQEIVGRGDEALCLVISSRLSGAYSSASIAALSVTPQRIAVVDSRTTAGGLTLLLKQAAKLARCGVSLKSIADSVKQMRKRTGTAFSVSSMDSLRRSGRLSVVRQSVNTILNIRPILLLDKDEGALVSGGTARGRSAQMQALADQVPENASEVLIQSLGSTAAPALLEKVRAKLPHASITCGTLGPVLGVNIGLDAIGVSWISE